MNNAKEFAEALLPLKGMIFDLPQEQQDQVLKIKAAIMLTAGPGISGFLACCLAFGELAVMAEKGDHT